MRRLPVFRKKKYAFCAAAMAVVIAIVSVAVPEFPSLKVYATSSTKEQMDEAKREKEKKEQELKEAQSQLSSTQNEISKLQNVKNSYQGKMNLLNTQLQEVADNLAVMEKKIEIKQMEIDETKAALQEAIETKDNQFESMKKRIQFMYEKGGRFSLEYLFSSKSLGEFLNYADYIQQLSDYDRRKLEEYKETERLVQSTKESLEEELEELESLKDDILAEQGKVSGLISETATSIANTIDSIDDMQKEADAYEQECDARAAEAAAAEEEYKKLKAQYEEELRISRLAAQSARRDISQVTFEESDRYLLANLIYCEAGNQPYEGQVGVGAVVINRVLSSVFPDTVTGVIYQYKQFSPVLDGHLAAALAQDKATESCYRAADDAMAGVTTVGGCVYFRTPKEGLTGLQIGGHIFY